MELIGRLADKVAEFFSPKDSKIYFTLTGRGYALWSSEREKEILVAGDIEKLAKNAIDEGYIGRRVVRVKYDDAPPGMQKALNALRIKGGKISNPPKRDALVALVNALDIRGENAHSAEMKKLEREALAKKKETKFY